MLPVPQPTLTEKHNILGWPIPGNNRHKGQKRPFQQKLVIKTMTGSLEVVGSIPKMSRLSTVKLMLDLLLLKDRRKLSRKFERKDAVFPIRFKRAELWKPAGLD